ncbi:MAG: hypothetical protein KF799_00975 [Bdellovibrionales bacterium]|nr:hypothetical protein [Bdellovibrionales bacterium]
MKYLLILASLSLFSVSCASSKKEEPPPAPAELTQVSQEAEAAQSFQADEPTPEPVKKTAKKGKKTVKKSAKKTK